MTDNMFSLKGKTVVVTGGGRGVGKGISRAMAKCGANVVLAGRSAAPLESTAAECQKYGAKTLTVATDITKHEDIARLVAEATDKFGYIDCWVNNAGSANKNDVGPLIKMTEAQWDAVVDLNLKWTFFSAQAAARAMTKGGSIINISSRSGSQPNPNTGQYGAAKAGVENLTMTMGVEWGHMGIRVNAVALGVVFTDEGKSVSMNSEKRIRRQIETVPMRRIGTVDDVGPLCVYLASDVSSWVTGTVISVNGGSRISVGLLSYLHHVNKKMDEAEAAAKK